MSKLIIAHRGNIKAGDLDVNNNPGRIPTTIEAGFHCEIDLWKVRGILYLGHDEPTYKIKTSFLDEYRKKLWIHVKNADALSFVLGKKYRYFWHQNDDYTLVSTGEVWCYPEKAPVGDKSILVIRSGHPEINNVTENDLNLCHGVCTDDPYKFKDYFESRE